MRNSKIGPFSYAKFENRAVFYCYISREIKKSLNIFNFFSQKIERNQSNCLNAKSENLDLLQNSELEELLLIQ